MEAQSSRRPADAGPSSHGAAPVGTSLLRATPPGSCECSPGGAVVTQLRVRGPPSCQPLPPTARPAQLGITSCMSHPHRRSQSAMKYHVLDAKTM